MDKPIVDENEQASDCVMMLLRILTLEQLKLFSKELSDLVEDPGYGNVQVTAFDHRVQRIKVEKSFSSQ